MASNSLSKRFPNTLPLEWFTKIASFSGEVASNGTKMGFAHKLLSLLTSKLNVLRILFVGFCLPGYPRVFKLDFCGVVIFILDDNQAVRPVIFTDATQPIHPVVTGH